MIFIPFQSSTQMTMFTTNGISWQCWIKISPILNSFLTRSRKPSKSLHQVSFKALCWLFFSTILNRPGICFCIKRSNSKNDSSIFLTLFRRDFFETKIPTLDVELTISLKGSITISRGVLYIVALKNLPHRCLLVVKTSHMAVEIEMLLLKSCSPPKEATQVSHFHRWGLLQG